MKKVEIIAGILFAIGLCMSMLLVSGGNFLFIISSGFLCVFYFGFSTFLIHDIPFKNIFKKDLVNTSIKIRSINSRMLGWVFAVTILGILFKTMIWMGATLYLAVGLIGLGTLGLISSYNNAKNPTSYYKAIIQRVGIWGILGLISLSISNSAIIIFRYRNYPEYLQAWEKAKADPQNKDLWKKVYEERAKVWKNK